MLTSKIAVQISQVQTLSATRCCWCPCLSNSLWWRVTMFGCKRLAFSCCMNTRAICQSWLFLGWSSHSRSKPRRMFNITWSPWESCKHLKSSQICPVSYTTWQWGQTLMLWQLGMFTQTGLGWNVHPLLFSSHFAHAGSQWPWGLCWLLWSCWLFQRIIQNESSNEVWFETIQKSSKAMF